MHTIWIVNDAGHPYEKALDLIPGATLRPLTKGNVNPLRTDRVAQQISQGIGRYALKDDYLLISGTPMLNLLAGVIWMRKFRKLQVLQWNALHREYELSTIDAEHISDLLEKEMVR